MIAKLPTNKTKEENANYRKQHSEANRLYTRTNEIINIEIHIIQILIS